MTKKKKKKREKAKGPAEVVYDPAEAMKLLNSPWGNHLVSQAIHICVMQLTSEPLRYRENAESDLFKRKIADFEILRNALFPSYGLVAGTVDQSAIELKMARMSDGETEEIMQEAIISP